MIVLIDNFDSFTYNIVQAYQQLGESVHVIRNHEAHPGSIADMNPDLVVIGPGPGNPVRAGFSKACVHLAEQGIPVFGICLGHQAIAEVSGASIVRAPLAVHGKTSSIYHLGCGVFSGLTQGFKATRYHSLLIDPSTLPDTLEITAWTSSQEIMGVRHSLLPLEGVQFHPESAASEEGMKLLNNSLYLSLGVKLYDTGPSGSSPISHARNCF